MKFMKLQLLVIVSLLLIAGSAFASFTYDVTVNTSSLSGDAGYLYLQYFPTNGASSTATVFNFSTNGTLGAQDTVDVVNGSAVTGTLPGTVVFANLNSVNDYDQAITFGKSFSFYITLSAPVTGGATGGYSTFSLGLFADPYGNTPSLADTVNELAPGTLFAVNLMNNDTTSVSIDASEATVTPIPGTVWLLGSALTGLIGLKRRIFG